MAPPFVGPPLHLDVEAISGICGSISIACWVVVFSPQILQNFQRGSTEGLSIQFVIAWLLGDVFNILGAVLQSVLPTMIILAVYYALADIVLLLQCFYYRGLLGKSRNKSTKRSNGAALADERTGLLRDRRRRGSDWSNLSPAVPLIPDALATPSPPPTVLQTILWNTLAVLMVCGAGILGWAVSRGREHPASPGGGSDDGNAVAFSFWGQIFGYFSAALYIFSRVPQLVLNFRRKSTDGLSMLFFLFASLGNVTYVLSIVAYEPRCAGGDGGACAPGEAGRLYGQYILVNLSWLLGSFVTLLLDFGVFAQYFMYSTAEEAAVEGEEEEEVEEEERGFTDEYSDEEGSEDDAPWNRPLLARGNSTFG